MIAERKPVYKETVGFLDEYGIERGLEYLFQAIEETDHMNALDVAQDYCTRLINLITELKDQTIDMQQDYDWAMWEEYGTSHGSKPEPPELNE